MLRMKTMAVAMDKTKTKIWSRSKNRTRRRVKMSRKTRTLRRRHFSRNSPSMKWSVPKTAQMGLTFPSSRDRCWRRLRSFQRG